jgi:hypothetical protein
MPAVPIQLYMKVPPESSSCFHCAAHCSCPCGSNEFAHAAHSNLCTGRRWIGIDACCSRGVLVGLVRRLCKNIAVCQRSPPPLAEPAIPRRSPRHHQSRCDNPVRHKGRMLHLSCWKLDVGYLASAVGYAGAPGSDVPMAIAAKIDMAFMAAGGTLLVPSATSNFQVVGVSLVPTMAPTLIATTTAAAGAATTAGAVRRVRATH